MINMFSELTSDNDNIVYIWTDGGCINNPGIGAIGILMQYKNHRKEITAYANNTTNNQMELLASIIALQNLKKPSLVKLYSDSNYLIQGITEWIYTWRANNWKNSKKQTVKNKKLWIELDKLLQIHSVEFFWVKGHADNENNNKVDIMCKQAMEKKDNILSDEYLLLLKDSS